MILKSVPKAAQACHEHTLEKIFNEREGKPDRNCMWLWRQSLKLASVFEAAVRNFILVFLLKKNNQEA